MSEDVPQIPVPKRCSGAVGNCTEPVAYLWTGPHAGVYGLCVVHCAEWRSQVRGTPLEPVRIRSAEAAAGKDGER
jgi:hypothetical protein